MVVDAVEIHGMADLPSLNLGALERLSHIKGPDPASVALGDGLELFFAALAPAHLHGLVRRWGLLEPDEEAEVIAEPFPDQARWTVPAASADLVSDAKQRAITVAVTLSLDPLLFRDLRAEAARHPRLVTALADGPVVTITVGALFAQTFDALALSINTVKVGQERFPTLSSERAAWMSRLLTAIGTRFHRYTPDVGQTAAWALAAATSRERHAHYTAWQAALQDRLGAVRVALGPGGAPMILVNEQPLRRWGEEGARATSLAAAIYLSGADVLWAESEDPLLAGGVERGALEQIITLGPGGDRIVEAPKSQKKASAFRVRGPR
jgi:hypothetical protein